MSTIAVLCSTEVLTCGKQTIKAGVMSSHNDRGQEKGQALVTYKARNMYVPPMYNPNERARRVMSGGIKMMT